MKAIVTVPFTAGPNEEHGLAAWTEFKEGDTLEGDIARLAVNQKWALETVDAPPKAKASLKIEVKKEA